jgi:CubicO group peptidase (beta-lactamase class C family)
VGSLNQYILSIFFLNACSVATTSSSHENAVGAKVADNFLQASRPTEQGFKNDKLCGTLEGVAQGKDNIHALLIERHGKILGEVYRNGSDKTLMNNGFLSPFSSTVEFDKDKIHDTRSISKSIVGLLYGIYVEQGRIKLDEPFLNYYPEYSELKTRGRDKITVKHLLTMSSGLAWSEIGHGTFTSDETALFWKKEPVKYYFDRKLENEPGHQFNYSGGAAMALADLLTRIDGRSLKEIAEEKLFRPMEISEWEWATSLQKIPLANSGLRLRPRDMLKLGRLLNKKGQWNQKQIIPKEWIEQATSPQIGTSIGLFSTNKEPAEYGYQIWLGSSPYHQQAIRWVAAVGNGGQRIFTVPALDLTVVVTSGDYGEPEIQKAINSILKNILECIET